MRFIDRVTDKELRAWRGSIATTFWDGPGAPRPHQSNNVIFTAMYDNPTYTAEDRKKMLEVYPYSHFAMGPLIQGGYGGRWDKTNFLSNPDEFLDRVEEVWDAEKIPCLFLLDDTGVFADGAKINREEVERVLTPLYSLPRFQKLFKVVVLAWEPDYTHSDYVWGVKWMKRVFPNAKRYIHLPSEHGATGRGSELAERYPKDHPLAGQLKPGEPNEKRPFLDEGEMWGGIDDPNRPGGIKEAVAPHIHGLLVQNTYSFLGDTDEGRTPEEQVLYNAWDFIRRFQEGYAGWPTQGADGPVDVVMFEWGSYAQFDGGPGRFGTFEEAQRASIEMGRKLLEVKGIAGVGDGCPTSAQPPVPPPVKDPILDTVLVPAYPTGYLFWIQNWEALAQAAKDWYLRANGRPPASSDVGHGLWRALNEGNRWKTVRNAFEDTWPGGAPRD